MLGDEDRVDGVFEGTNKAGPSPHPELQLLNTIPLSSVGLLGKDTVGVLLLSLLLNYRLFFLLLQVQFFVQVWQFGFAEFSFFLEEGIPADGVVEQQHSEHTQQDDQAD